MKKFAFVDIETTTLDPRSGGAIIQVALLVTDQWLEEIDCIERPVRPGAGVRWNEWCIQQHTKTGLKEACMSASPIGIVQAELVAFMGKHFDDERPPMCGSSVHFDRSWLVRHMGRLEECFHYRNIDVSSVWQFLEGFCGAQLPREGEPAHTALADLRTTVREATRFRHLIVGEGR